MSSIILNVTVDCINPMRIARFWADVTGWALSCPADDEYCVAPGGPGMPRLYFVRVPEPKVTKNRIHLDVIPADRSQDEELARLTGLGATVISDQRPDVGWVILLDPEGNEFDVEPSAAELGITPGQDGR